MDNNEVKVKTEQRDEPGIWVKLPNNNYFFCDKCGEHANTKKPVCPKCGKNMV